MKFLNITKTPADSLPGFIKLAHQDSNLEMTESESVVYEASTPDNSTLFSYRLKQIDLSVDLLQ